MAAANQLGTYLRARRALVTPGEVGLPAGVGLRRTPGLRREELAALAGISIDYYTRLEQGKETNPSCTILHAIACALRLDEDGRAYLYRVADLVACRATLPTRTDAEPLRAGTLRLLETLRPYPALVLSRRSDVLAANPEAFLLFPGLDDEPPDRRNTIRYVFTYPLAHSLYVDWPHAAATGVANLHNALGDDPDDGAAAQLADELRTSCDEFARLWQRYDTRPQPSQTKSLRHPRVGDLTVDVEILRIDPPGRRIVVYHAPPGTADHDALVLLSMTSTPSEAGPAST